MMLHRFAKFLVACTVLLILAGSLVTSHDAGLSVPDWPTSYGWNMFTFPPSMWVANILYEHGHRLIASTVGFLTIIMAVWLWLAGYGTAPSVDDITLRRFATAVTALIYAQILVGATMRHTGAGLAIPDFPWMFGHLVPDHWNGKIAIHFAHRVGALLVTLGAKESKDITFAFKAPATATATN